MVGGVAAHEAAEKIHLVVLQGLGNGVGELGHAGDVDLVHGGQVHLLDLGASHLLNGAEHAALARGDKQDCLTSSTRAAGAADAVDVALRVVRDVVVEHVGNALHIQTACGDVGGDEDV